MKIKCKKNLIIASLLLAGASCSSALVAGTYYGTSGADLIIGTTSADTVYGYKAPQNNVNIEEDLRPSLLNLIL